MSKYYTPTIEEFHVGFEFEYLTLEYGETSWRQEVFCDKYSAVSSKSSLEVVMKRGCRVKHLDQEDIESLGIGNWTDSHGYWRGFKTKNENQYYVFHHNVDRVQSWCVVEIVDKDTEKRRVLFTGTIKNKSELKKVLKMIGYETV